MRKREVFKQILAAGAVIFSLGTMAWAQQHPVPLDDGAMAQGVASCAGTTCHSRQTASGAIVRQNEILTWQDPSRSSGAHSRAYQVLMTPQGQAISRLAGFGPAEKAPECLSCHAHDVPETQWGDQFNISEGVTCESCHGNAEKWLSTHYAVGVSHEDNLANGLFPTTDVEKTTSLCLDCHFGSTREKQFVTHRIMGAGHPRMSFELELFTALQQHHTVDMDYLERKSMVRTSSMKNWAVGQAIALERATELFTDDELGRDGLFPELYFFDCHACHQPLSNDRQTFAGWRPNPGRPLGPGVPVFTDSNLIMLKAAVAEVMPERSAEFSQVGARLHAATRVDHDATKLAAAALADYSRDLREAFLDTEFDSRTTMNILSRILDATTAAEYTNYAAGEQAVIAVDVFLNAMVDQGAIEFRVLDELAPEIDEAFDAVQNPSDYDAARLRRALLAIADRTRRL
ncbi:multiheme c-type cytochrome [Parvularcula marina]|uniref:multiheme c-type cytochrome n=1 Tax=Parvularcula marina TaxID=2292771 RepID=UPI00351233A8